VVAKTHQVAGASIDTDVVVVGGGNAGFAAAHAAAERGRRVLLLEKGARDVAGGNSYFTAGATRVAHGGLEDLLDVIDADPRHDRAVVPPYSPDEYAADLARLTGGRNDPALTAVLVDEAYTTVRWLHGLGMRYRLLYERQAYEASDGRIVFFGGLHIGNVDGGIGLMAAHAAIATRLGVDVRLATRAVELVMAGGRVVGLRAADPDGPVEVAARSVVLAAGGFEADPELRRRHLGPGWERAHVRGTPLNTGEMITAALRVGAATAGDWAGAHSVQWDAHTSGATGDRQLTNRLTRQSYPLGILVNADGNRFVDEGADFRNFTYASYGRAVLEQPGAIAFQLFDATTRPLLRTEEYDMPGVSVATADTIDELARRIGVDPTRLGATVDAFNASIDTAVPFDPAIKDGRRAALSLPKSNWAVPLESPPFYAFAVTCGITFTFGGVRGDVDGRVLDTAGSPIEGLFVCGEMLGGLFWGNYPGGSGLAAGMVFGRRAGTLA
jgi:tricarballylate dehydrogenase